MKIWAMVGAMIISLIFLICQFWITSYFLGWEYFKTKSSWYLYFLFMAQIMVLIHISFNKLNKILSKWKR
jgi:hypothetical protein